MCRPSRRCSRSPARSSPTLPRRPAHGRSSRATERTARPGRRASAARGATAILRRSRPPLLGGCGGGPAATTQTAARGRPRRSSAGRRRSRGSSRRSCRIASASSGSRAAARSAERSANGSTRPSSVRARSGGSSRRRWTRCPLRPALAAAVPAVAERALPAGARDVRPRLRPVRAARRAAPCGRPPRERPCALRAQALVDAGLRARRGRPERHVGAHDHRAPARRSGEPE